MHYVIIGAGPSGVIAAETLRKLDADADITLIGNEQEAPYSRMALPYFLVRKIPEQGTYLRTSAGHFSDLRIAVLKQHVSQVHTTAQRLTFADGTQLAYDKLLIATGSSPVTPPIPGIDLPGIYHCWTLADARAIAQCAVPGARVVLLGAGFIGCIILEALVKSGAELTVVEMGDRMVPRMMNERAGGLIKQWCAAKGVKVCTSMRISGIAADGADALRISLSDGSCIPADMLVAAAGVKPNIDFLQDCAIKTDQGILINRQMQTSVAGVYAAGDVAQGLDFSTGEYAVQAIQPTASEHGQLAAKNMAGLRQALHQGSVNMNVLDTLGLISSSFGLWRGVNGGEMAEHYDPEHYRYLNLQFQDDRLVGATSIGLTQHIGILRGLIQSKISLGVWKERLQQDPSRIMEAYLAASQVLT